MFSEFDQDGDGHLTAEEIAYALQSRGVKLTPEVAQKYIDGMLMVCCACQGEYKCVHDMNCSHYSLMDSILVLAGPHTAPHPLPTSITHPTLDHHTAADVNSNHQVEYDEFEDLLFRMAKADLTGKMERPTESPLKRGKSLLEVPVFQYIMQRDPSLLQIPGLQEFASSVGENMVGGVVVGKVKWGV